MPGVILPIHGFVDMLPGVPVFIDGAHAPVVIDLDMNGLRARHMNATLRVPKRPRAVGGAVGYVGNMCATCCTRHILKIVYLTLLPPTVFIFASHLQAQVALHTQGHSIYVGGSGTAGIDGSAPSLHHSRTIGTCTDI